VKGKSGKMSGKNLLVTTSAVNEIDRRRSLHRAKASGRLFDRARGFDRSELPDVDRWHLLPPSGRGADGPPGQACGGPFAIHFTSSRLVILLLAVRGSSSGNSMYSGMS
jgi:hypothetical protein